MWFCGLNATKSVADDVVNSVFDQHPRAFVAIVAKAIICG